MGERISSFKDLRVYKLAFEIQQGILDISKRFLREERYALTDQIRRASRSIGANISEAWQKRRYVAHFVSKLTDADGHQAKSQPWLDTAAACLLYTGLPAKSRVREMLENRSNARNYDGKA